MPSPTSSTRPTSRVSIPVRVCLISSLMTETISSTRNAMTAPLDQLSADLVQPGADAGVIDPVADPDDQPAQEFRLDLFFQQRLDLADRPHVVAQPGPLAVGQRNRRADLDHHAPRAAVVHVLVGKGD